MIDKSLLQLKGFKGIMVFLTAMAVLQGITIIFQAKYLAVTVTNLFNGEKLSLQLLPILLFVAFYLAKQLIVFVREGQMQRYATRVGSELRQQFTKKLFTLGPRITEQEGTGHLVTMSLEGITQVETYIKLFLPKVMNMVLIPILIFVYTFTLDVRSSVVLLLVLPTLLVFMVILGIAAKKKADTQYETHQLLSNHFVDSLRGLETLRLLGLSKKYDRNIRKVSERYRKSTMNTLKYAFLSTFALDFFSSLAVAIVALFLGLGLLNEQIVLLPALTVLILAPDYFLPIREFGTDYHATLDGKNAFQAIQQINSYSEKEGSPSVTLKQWNENSVLKISDLSLIHDEATTPTLKDISFEWRGNGKIGIIGASGSGKSSLINILSGFSHTDSGNITVDQSQLDHFSTTAWQEQLLYIPQHPYIFNNTVANNIAFYTPNATSAEIEKAAKDAGLDEVITQLPNGYEEEIGESGRLLSGGQEQRIALARAFLDEQRKILLFDEPTAHLDIETEAELKENMLPLFENRLVFFATHRLHWMLEMDYILVLDKGEIVERGTHTDLYAAKGHYYQLIQAQLHGTTGVQNG